MNGGGPGGPDGGDSADGFAGLRWQPTRPDDAPGWPGGQRSARVLAVADAIAIVVALVLIIATVAIGRALGGVDLLLGPGILLLIVGQVCAIVVMRARRPPRTGRRHPRGIRRQRSIGQDLNRYFGPADPRATRVVAALCVIGVLSFITGIFFTFHGSPLGPGGGCAYRLSSHGVVSCVSQTAYELAGAAQQRMVAGIFLFFYAMHFYAALASSRSAQPTAPSGQGP
jgi:hypothetical protein